MSPPAQVFWTIDLLPELLLKIRGFMITADKHTGLPPPGPLTPKRCALAVLQGTLDKSMQQTAYIMSAREACVSAQLLPSVAGSSGTPGLLPNAPPKGIFSFTHGSCTNTSWIHHWNNQLHPKPGHSQQQWDSLITHQIVTQKLEMQQLW